MLKVGKFQLCVCVLMTKMENVRINLFIILCMLDMYNEYIYLFIIYYYKLEKKYNAIINSLYC